jgi:HK97 family phage portal protein
MSNRFSRFIGRFKWGHKEREDKTAKLIHIKTSVDVIEDPPWADNSQAYKYSENDAGDKALQASTWVYACAEKIATSTAAIELRAYAGDKELPDTHPLAVLLKEPLPGISQSLWMYAVSMYFTTGGQTYLEKIRASINGVSATGNGKGLTKELWPFSGSTFKPEVPENVRRTVPTGYTPTVGDLTEISPDDIIHVRKPRPSDINAGFGPVEGAEAEINIDSQAAGWQQMALGNRGVPDGIFAYTGEYGLNEEQKIEFDAEIGDKWTGIKNAHRPFVLGESVKWIPLANTMVDVELIPGRTFTKEAICATHGVPTVLFDASGATYANLASAMLQLMSTVVMPNVKTLVDLLNVNLSPEYGETINIQAKPASNMAMMPLIENQWKVAKEAQSTGAPMDQVFESVGLNLEPYPGIDTGWVAVGLQDVDAFDTSGTNVELSTRSTLNQVRKRRGGKRGKDHT